MENGVEALKMASGMLIFVLAITITISVFTMATQALNRIFDMQNDDEYVTDADGNFLNFINFEEGNGTRVVGVETIVPSIYRAYKENYAIYFYKSTGEKFVLRTEEKEKYDKESGITTTVKEEINYIDLEKEKHASAEEAINKITHLLYQESDLFDKGLYEELSGKTFVERLGEYYMDDVLGETETAEVNKIKKRVIVYTQQ